MPGKNRGKKRKTQYCLPYTRRGNQLWQPVCPFLRFLPYTYGEASASCWRHLCGPISSLHVWGSPHAHDPSLTCHVVFPTCYGGVPSSPGDARTGSWSSLHVWGSPCRRRGQHADGTVFPTLRGSSLSRPVPHAPDATFRKAGSLSACTAFAPMLRAGMDGLSWGRVFPGPFFALFLARDSDAQ